MILEQKLDYRSSPTPTLVNCDLCSPTSRLRAVGVRNTTLTEYLTFLQVQLESELACRGTEQIICFNLYIKMFMWTCEAEARYIFLDADDDAMIRLIEELQTQ